MFNISSYLEKFNKIEPKGESVRCATIKAIYETLGVKIEKKDVLMRNNTLHISASAALRNEIFMNKQGILKKTREIAGNGSVVDMR